MKYDENTSLLLKIEIDYLIRFYNSATPSQKKIIRKQLKILKFLLKRNQYCLRKKCKKTGHSYTQWFQVPSHTIFNKKLKIYKTIRTCHICGHNEYQKKKTVKK